jgi:hypothetical protein
VGALAVGIRSKLRAALRRGIQKHPAASRRSIQWLAAIAVIILTLVIVWALFVRVADWLAHHDVGSVRGSLHETAVDNARGRLLTLGAGLFAAGALLYTVRTFNLSRQGQVTDRYTQAINQLGSKKKLDVRIGGIYALERVARDSRRDHPTVMEVLTAFIRDHSREPWPLRDSSGPEQERSTRPDIQAALTVVGRRDPSRDIRAIDLTGAVLRGADLVGADLGGADLSRADLSGAVLRGADLRGVALVGADLTSADLSGAVLRDASLADAILSRAIVQADLTGARLDHAGLHDADVSGSIFPGAYLADARWPESALVPYGWRLDPGSGRLERESTGSGSAARD